MKIVRRNYVVLLLLSLLFAAPGLSAYLFYTHPAWLGEATTNKGILLSPPVLLTLTDSQAARSKWQLVLWSPNACKKSCILQLDKLARIRLALGRRLYEVDARLLLGPNAPQLSDKLAKALHERDIQLSKLSVSEHDRMLLLQNNLAIYIVNPDDYLVLAYSTEVNPDDIYHDIKQLLTK